jgi:fatty acid desaturase
MQSTKISKNFKDKYRYKRHRFHVSVLKELRSCYTLDNWHGCLEVIEDWLIILVSAVISLWVWRNCTVTIGIIFYVVAVVVIGARQHGVADLLHQASHGTLAKDKKLNFLLGTFFSGYLVLQSFTGYTSSHISNHHPYLGNPELDPDYKGLIGNHIYGEDLTNSSVISYLWSLSSPKTTLKYLRYLIKYRMLNSDEELWERLIRGFYLSALAILSISFNLWQEVIAYWVIPLLTTASWTGSLVELLEHYPFMEVAPKTDVYMSRNRFLHPAVNFFLGKHWDGYHLIHHLFPGIPSWKYSQAHTILIKDTVYASQQRGVGFSSIWDELVLNIRTYTPS